MGETKVGSLERAVEPEKLVLQSELASLSEQLREANKAKEEAEERARVSAVNHEEPWSSTAAAERLKRSQAEQDAATVAAMRLAADINRKRKAAGMKKHSKSSGKRKGKRFCAVTTKELQNARIVAFMQAIELTKEREKRKNFENLLHDQSNLKAAMTLFPAGTQLADEESDSDYM